MTAARITPAELCESLGIERPRVLALVKEGLPWWTAVGRPRRRFSWEHCAFDEDAVAEWLIARGYLAPPRLAQSIGELARHFGVSKRRIWQWRDEGAPINKLAPFELEPIEEWRAARHGRDEGEQDETRAVYETDRARIKAEKEQWELDELRARLIDVEIVERVVARHMAELRAQLESAAEFQISLLPAGTAGGIVRRVRDETAKRSAQILARQAEMLEDLAEEIKLQTKRRKTT